MVVLGYIRQSRDKLKQEHSEAYQFDALMRYHEGRKIQSDKWPRDIVWSRDIETSGRTVPFFERPGGIEIRDRAQQGDIVIAHKMDRMGRDCVDMLQIADWFDGRGVAIHLLDIGGNVVDTKSATGRFVLTVLAAAAQFEGDKTAERTVDTLATLRRQGRRSNYRPGHGNKFVDTGERDSYGKPIYRVEPDLELRMAIHRAMQMREQGYTYQAITAALTLNHPCPPHMGNKGQWTWRSVEKLVKRERQELARREGAA